MNFRHKFVFLFPGLFVLIGILIFPMKEVEEKKFKFSNYKKINIKLSNMDMKIILNKIDKFPNLTNKILLEKDNSKSKILPSFTKKIFSSIQKI